MLGPSKITIQVSPDDLCMLKDLGKGDPSHGLTKLVLNYKQMYRPKLPEPSVESKPAPKVYRDPQVKLEIGQTWTISVRGGKLKTLHARIMQVDSKFVTIDDPTEPLTRRHKIEDLDWELLESQPSVGQRLQNTVNKFGSFKLRY